MQTLIAVVILAVALITSEVAESASADLVAAEIRTEAIRSNGDATGHPLPLASHWTTGKHPLSTGWAPVHQMELIEQGHFLLPWFEHPDDDDAIENDVVAFVGYYKAAITRARELKLPLVLEASQWERSLSVEPYLSLPPDKNPNVVTTEGKVLRMVSPFGPLEPWREVGRKLTDNRRMRMLQEWYPNPPKVIFLSNNEHSKLVWKDVETSVRYMEKYGKGRDDNYKRKVIAEGWITRYRALQAGMRDGLGTVWKSRAIFVGYDAFGPVHLGRWGDWMRHSLYVPDRIDPSPLIWDGGSPSFYVHNWNSITDYKAYSPQIESMNWVFMQRETATLNPEFWFEMSVWDGHEPGDRDKRASYERLGQTYTPQRYAGMVQFGMWLLRPRVVREFRSWLQPWDDGRPYFMAIVDAVDRVHTDPILREWWRIGHLVPNRAHRHPYQSNIPPEYANEDRWFLLDANVNPRFPWDLTTEVPVFSLALVKGTAPTRAWLVYAHAPLGDRKNVRLTVPGYGAVNIDVTVGGSFYLIDEKDRTAHELDARGTPR
jgi:hypothetical protein